MNEPEPLTQRQAEVLAEVVKFHSVTQEGPSLGYLYRRLDTHSRYSVRCHLRALWRKGWINSPGGSARPQSWLGDSVFRRAFLVG